MGRRIETPQAKRSAKRVYDWDSQSEEWESEATEHRKYVWSGWLMLMELDGLADCGVPGDPDDCIVRKYTRGLDLAGQMGGTGVSPVSLESAGGIGGLLAVWDADASTGPAGADGNYIVLYDANGNVGQLVAWGEGVLDGGTPPAPVGTAWHDNRLAAHYEYDPYGGVAFQGGPYADVNTWRFSTKQWDDETGLGYWGYRYYSPGLGRWMSRDPIGERGGHNIYGYVTNRPVAQVDALGYIARDWRSWFDPDYLWPAPCDPQYPPPNPPKDKPYDCVGLACRTYTAGRSSDVMLEGFRIGSLYSIKCEPCEIKCWVWEFKEGLAKNGKLDKSKGGRVNSHIVCGQVGRNGEDPKCYNKFGTWGQLEGPADCGSFKPPEKEGVPGYPDWQFVRWDYMTYYYCGPASAVPGLKS